MRSHDVGTIAENHARLGDRIRAAAAGAGREPSGIGWVAVSKTVGPEQVREAFAAGVRLFGENRAQELVAKTAALEDLPIEWHFVGHLQTNKVRQVLPRSTLIHSVDRVDVARKINGRASPEQPQPILVQVNTTGEATKSGVVPQRLGELLDSIATLPNLIVDGLMTIGPFTSDETEIRTAFRDLRELLVHERQAERPNAPLRHLSMGMSNDFEIAIQEGATLLRIGTALFGPRST
jgi:pyridoxal phosphate enzyme (YggS family)